MSKIFNSYIFKFSVVSIISIVILYLLVDTLPGVFVVIFSFIGAWRTGEWIVKLADKLVKKYHKEDEV